MSCERDHVPLHPERSQHRPHWQPHMLQHRALLDVQFQIRSRVAKFGSRFGSAIQIDTIFRDRIDQLYAVFVRQISNIVRRERTGRRARSE